MNRHYSEKRNFHRMAVDCPCRFRLAGGNEEYDAIVKNLSADGILLWTKHIVPDGASLEVSIESPGGLSDKFVAVAEVVRSQDAADAGYSEVACQMIPLS